MARWPLLALSALVIVGCKRDPIPFESDETDTDPGTGIDSEDTDTGDTDTGDTDTDSDTGSPDQGAPSGFAFCSGGGRVTGSGYTATLCVGPVDMAVGTVSGSGYTWQAGPIFVLDP